VTTKSKKTVASVLAKHISRREMDGLARLVDAPCPHSFTERVDFLLSLCVEAPLDEPELKPRDYPKEITFDAKRHTGAALDNIISNMKEKKDEK